MNRVFCAFGCLSNGVDLRGGRSLLAAGLYFLFDAGFVAGLVACIEHCESNGGAGIDRELFKDAADVCAHSPVAYVQHVGDLLVGRALEQQVAYLAFTQGKVELLLQPGS